MAPLDGGLRADAPLAHIGIAMPHSNARLSVVSPPRQPWWISRTRRRGPTLCRPAHDRSAAKTVRSAIAPMLVDARVSAPSIPAAGRRIVSLDGRGDWLQVRVPMAKVGAGLVSSAPAGVAHFDGLWVWRARPSPQQRAVRRTPRSWVTVIDADQCAYLFHLVAAVARRRVTLCGASYLGRCHPVGCDCSGRAAHSARYGIALPRERGGRQDRSRVSDDASGDHEAGDLLYFSDREDLRITHVGSLVHIAWCTVR
jgi:hypothetical protein